MSLEQTIDADRVSARCAEPAGTPRARAGKLNKHHNAMTLQVPGAKARRWVLFVAPEWARVLIHYGNRSSGHNSLNGGRGITRGFGVVPSRASEHRLQTCS